MSCKIFNSGVLKNNCEENCKIHIETVDQLDNLTSEAEVEQGDVERRKCIMIDENNCQYSFLYEINLRNETKKVQVLPKKQCPQSVLVFQIVSSIVLAVLLIGIVGLLSWKTITTYKDRKNYQQWLEYLQNRQFTSEGENPLYQAPNTKYKNPLYKANNT